MTDENNNKIMSYDEAFTFLLDKYDTLFAEVDYWLCETNLPRYNAEGEALTDDQPSFFDRKILKETDFEKEYPYYKKVPCDDIEGPLIRRFQAESIIKDQFKKHKNYAGFESYTIPEILSTLNAYIKPLPNKYGFFIVSNNLSASVYPFYYSENDIKKLNVIAYPKCLYIDFKALMKRNGWKGYEESSICIFLIRMNDERRLKAISQDHYIPRKIIRCLDGKIMFSKWDSVTGHYGYDAQELIGNKQAIFQLSEIIDVENDFFQNTYEEIELKVRDDLDDVRQLSREEYAKIMNGDEQIPLSKKHFAKRILNTAKKQKITFSPRETAKDAKGNVYKKTEKEKEDSTLETIVKKLTDIAKKDNSPSYSQRIKSIENYLEEKK